MPADVQGVKVLVKFVDADTLALTDPAAFAFLTMTSTSSFRADFKPGEGGTTAVHLATGSAPGGRGENGRGRRSRRPR